MLGVLALVFWLRHSVLLMVIGRTATTTISCLIASVPSKHQAKSYSSLTNFSLDTRLHSHRQRMSLTTCIPLFTITASETVAWTVATTEASSSKAFNSAPRAYLRSPEIIIRAGAGC
jgi:hypothetical protein